VPVAPTLPVPAGCATTARVAIDGPQQQLSSTQVYVALRKQEIGTDIHRSNRASRMSRSRLAGCPVLVANCHRGLPCPLPTGGDHALDATANLLGPQLGVVYIP
jgi:hypothetical protein